MSGPELERLTPGVSDGEKRMWLASLRSPSGLSAKSRAELADILERQWFPPMDGGRPGRETWTTHYKINRTLRAWYLAGLIEDRMAAGMTRTAAEEEVCEIAGVESRALRAFLKDA